MTQRTAIVLAHGVTLNDVKRALAYSGLSVLSTVTPNLYTIDRAKRRLPPTVDFAVARRPVK